MRVINVTDVTKLQVYERSFNLAVKIFEYTQSFAIPSLVDQIVRSSSSVFANISEGMMFKNVYPVKTNSFLSIALGSCGETKTWLMYIKAIHLLDDSLCDELIQESIEISLMLCSLINKIYADHAAKSGSN